LFISLEGIDGSGKTTQAKKLAKALGEDTVLVREPGATETGERIRQTLLESGGALSPGEELELFCQAREALIGEVIQPALDAGRPVVTDRFSDSSVAYQGGGRGLGLDEVRRICDSRTGGLQPDLTILLRIDPGDARLGSGGTDRFESEGLDFAAAVAEAYDEIAAADPERVKVIDGRGSVKQVHARVMEEVGRLAHR
jgi:dTMP kinase